MTKFGPNKTSATFYRRCLLTLIVSLVTAIVVTVVLVLTLPELKELRDEWMGRQDDEQNHHANETSDEVYHRRHDTLASEARISKTLDLDAGNEVDKPAHDTAVSEPTETVATTPRPTSATMRMIPLEGDETDTVTMPSTATVFNSTSADFKGYIVTATNLARRPFDQSVGTSVQVNTTLGEVVGIQAKVFGKMVNAFLGIPFAEPPVGRLRFKRTVAAKPWRPEVRRADRVQPHCLQYFDPEVVRARHPTTFNMSEDCLYLNVWTPVDDGSANSTFGRRPVMFWLFGGGYGSGSNNLDEMDGRVLAAAGDVVVVTANYRNGALGFLDLGVDEVPGNQGLHDNVVAIKWMKANARSFGGDPDQMTLFGQSAGAISIGLLMTNPTTSGLFSRAILQSGSPVMLNFFFTRTEQTARQFLATTNCTLKSRGTISLNGTSGVDEVELDAVEVDGDAFPIDGNGQKDMVECLLSKTAEELVQAQIPLLEHAYPFTPTPFDYPLLPLMTSDAIKLEPGDEQYNETFKDIKEVLIGTNRDEASVVLFIEIPELFGIDMINLNITRLSQLKQLIVANFSQEFNIEPSKATFFANMFFAGGPEVDTTENLVRRLYQVIGDLAFTCPSTTLATALADRGKDVYSYEFGHRAQGSPWGSWMGVPHGDEYLFVFGYPLRYPFKFSGDDIDMSKRMMAAWSHFAWTGKMLPQLGREWPKFNGQSREYMELEGRHAKVGFKLHDEICTLFRFGLDSFRRRRKRSIGLGMF